MSKIWVAFVSWYDAISSFSVEAADENCATESAKVALRALERARLEDQAVCWGVRDPDLSIERIETLVVSRVEAYDVSVYALSSLNCAMFGGTPSAFTSRVERWRTPRLPECPCVAPL